MERLRRRLGAYVPERPLENRSPVPPSNLEDVEEKLVEFIEKLLRLGPA